MARSTYIYIVTYREWVGSSRPIGAATVKRELVEIMSRLTPSHLADVEVWRLGDGVSSGERTHLGTGTEFLARERPPQVADVRTALDRLDGTTASAVSLLTGMTPAELEDLGGFDG